MIRPLRALQGVAVYDTILSESTHRRRWRDQSVYQVMIVDDEPDTLDQLAGYVQRADPDFIVAAMAQTAEDALFFAGMIDPDLIITDVLMPVTDGLAMLQQMREAGWNGRAVVVSGHDEFNYAQQAIRLQVDDYLLKPVSSEDVRVLLRKIKESFTQEQARLDELRQDIMHEPVAAGDVLPDFLQKAMAYIKERFGEPLTLTQVARAVAVSPTYLSACFPKYGHANFVEYISRLRMTKAMELLTQTNLLVQEVAERVGYHDVAYFTRLFRRTTGQIPSKFRGNRS